MQQVDADLYMVTSSKDKINVAETFKQLTQIVVEKGGRTQHGVQGGKDSGRCVLQ